MKPNTTIMIITIRCLNEKTTVKIQSKISIKTDREHMTEDFVLELRQHQARRNVFKSSGCNLPLE